MSADQQHIAIVGSGSAASAAALKAVERGARVTLIEGAEAIGGTCVNVGCIPSKILIRAAHTAHQQARHGFDGVARNTPSIDRQAMLAQQQRWVAALRRAKYEHVLAAHPGITLVRGWARLIDRQALAVTRSDGVEQRINADRILLATGSHATIPDIEGLGDTPYWTSTEALAAQALPQHLAVIGSSVVALELAQAFHRLGTRVTLLSRGTLLSRQEPELGTELARLLEEEGLQVRLHSLPDAVSHDGRHFHIALGTETLVCDRLLVAAGRTPNTAGLGLERLGVALDLDGAIQVNDHLQSSEPSIYAAGDCSNLPRYVYVAAAAGSRAATNMTGGDAALDLSVLPSVIFTSPQMATVGLGEQQAKAQGLEVESRRLPLDQVPRAIVNMDARGFITLVAERSTGRIVGCQALAEEAGEIIQTAALAIRNRMTVEQLAEQLFPYLTLAEGLKLCAQTFTRDVSQLSCCAG